jgi:hypothetical protein
MRGGRWDRLGVLGLVGSLALVGGGVAAWALWTRPGVIRLLPVPPVATAPTMQTTPSGATEGSGAASAAAPIRAVGGVESLPHDRPGNAASTGVTGGVAATTQTPVIQRSLAIASSPTAQSSFLAGEEALTPVAVEIPATGVDANVVPEPVEPDGALVIPAPHLVGWDEDGPAPGQPGTTLLAGHVDDFGVPGAFLRLDAVPLGATVTVDTAGGGVFRYRVVERLVQPQSALVSSHLLQTTGAPRLVLMSCGGVYDPSVHLYEDNIVIVAQQVSATPPPASAAVTAASPLGTRAGSQGGAAENTTPGST